jgi:hypothetical protein
MNALANDPVAKRDELFSPFVLPPARSQNQRGDQQLLPRWSAEALTLAEPRAAEPVKALAAGVLKQAAHDLRRFRSATRGEGRELYLDAWSWVMANDFSWPLSFLNVCQSLNLVPEVVRMDLLGDASLGWFGYWVRRGGRISTAVQTYLGRILRTFANSTDKSESNALSAPLYQ